MYGIVNNMITEQSNINKHYSQNIDFKQYPEYPACFSGKKNKGIND